MSEYWVGDVTVRAAEPSDVALLDRFQRRYSNSVGFLREKDLVFLAGRGTAFTLEVNGESAGSIVLSGGERRRLCLRQLCIDDDLWGRGVGTELVQALLTEIGPAISSHDGVRVLTRADVSRQVAINERYGARTGARRTGVRGVATEEWLLWGARASGACAVEPGTSAPDVADVRRLPRPPGIVAALRAVAPDD